MSTSLGQFWSKWQVDVLLGVVGVNLLAIFVYLGNRENLLHPVAIYIGLYAVAFAFYLYAGRAILTRAKSHDRSLLWIIILFGIAFRLAVLHGVPSLSTDMYRYVWDGRLTCHWINPYRWSPWDPRLALLRDTAIWQPMEYKAYQTVYMPISQLFFAISYVLFRNNLIGFKAVFTCFDIGIMLLVMGILRRVGKDPARVIWYAWCPLPVIEVSLAGHQDVVGVFFLMLAIYLLTRGNQRIAALSLAAAGLTKGFALLLLPLFARQCGRRLFGVMAAALLYLGLPLWVYLADFLHGMQQYLGYVHVNGGVFALLDTLLSFVTRYHFNVVSKLSDAAILLAVGWSIWTKPQRYEEVARRAIVVLAVCLLVVPSLFPWYVVWLLPLVAIYGRQPSAAFICLAGVVDLVYFYYFDRAIHWWIQVAEYAPVYLLLWDEWRSGYWRPATLEAGGSESGVSEIERAGASAGTAGSIPGTRALDTELTW